MAKSGVKARVGQAGSPGVEETREALVRGAVAALKEEGFAGASARGDRPAGRLQPGPRLLPLRIGGQPAARRARRCQRDPARPLSSGGRPGGRDG